MQLSAYGRRFVWSCALQFIDFSLSGYHRNTNVTNQITTVKDRTDPSVESSDKLCDVVIVVTAAAVEVVVSAVDVAIVNSSASRRFLSSSRFRILSISRA